MKLSRAKFYLLLVPGVLVVLPSAIGGAEGAGEVPSRNLDDLLRDLRARFPDRESLAEAASDVARALLEFADHPVSATGGTEDAGRARILAAEVLLLAGSTREGRDLLRSVATAGPRDEDRAKALYLLGELYFFREQFIDPKDDAGGPRDSAERYWKQLSETYPDSPWTRRVGRPLRYLRLLHGGAAPSFRESFSVDGTTREYDMDSLRGKVVVLDFWRSGAKGQEASERELARDLPAALERYPELRGKIEVLGVNLDASRASFEAGVKEWALPWPQHHDGLGFATPLADLFGIPRDPHRAVIDPEGRLAYLGADHDGFYQALNRELRRLRGVAAETTAPAEKR